MTRISAYLLVRNLMDITPDIQSASPIGAAHLTRGLMVHLNVEPEFRSVAVVELNPSLGLRGRHMHKRKQETFYLISGRVLGRYWLEVTPDEVVEYTHEPGALITIQPGLFHELHPLEPSWMVELSPDPYDATDTFYPQSDAA